SPGTAPHHLGFRSVHHTRPGFGRQGEHLVLYPISLRANTDLPDGFLQPPRRIREIRAVNVQDLHAGQASETARYTASVSRAHLVQENCRACFSPAARASERQTSSSKPAANRANKASSSSGACMAAAPPATSGKV